VTNILGGQGVVDSVEPCTEYLTFGPWLYLVPQFKPRSVLMLGYAGGTVAGLIRKLYGDDFPITGVDVNEPGHDPAGFGVEFVQADAGEFVKDMERREVIIVDLWDENPSGLVFTPGFVADVSSRCDYLIVHAIETSDMDAYSHLPKVRTLGLEYGARFHYFMVNRVGRAPFRGRV